MYITQQNAIKLQKELAKRVIRENKYKELNYIAGVDVSQLPFKEDVPFYAAICILSFPSLEVLEQVSHSEKVDFPYIPGLLGFREAPIIIKALEKVKTKPDIILVDGHGINHPRQLGIASHIGVLTDYPTIGCAKSRLIGTPERELPLQKGNYVPLIWHGEVIGNLVRTKDKVNPVYVSTGHKVTLEKATEIVLTCVKKYRIPEPLRIAHQYANHVRKNSTEI